MEDLLRSIPAAASSPYALAAYAMATIVFLFAGTRLRMAKLLAARIETLPQAERRRALEIAADTILPTQISPEQWIRLRRLQWTFMLLAAILLAAVAVIVIALLNPVSKVESELSGLNRAARATQDRLQKVDEGLKQKVDQSTERIVGTVQDAALASLETMFPLAVRIDRDVDGTIMHLDGSPRQRVVSYDNNLKPMTLHWGDRFHYFVFSERGSVPAPSASVLLEIVANGNVTRLPLVLDPFTEHELRIPGSSPHDIDAFLVNVTGLSGISLKITVYSADRERGRQQFREALMNTTLSSAARRTYREVKSDGARLRASPESAGLVLRSLRVGTYVRVTNEESGWCHIRLPEGREGWVKCDLLGDIT